MKFDGSDSMERRIFLPGSEGYWDGWDRGWALHQMFPRQDIPDFAAACTNNSWGPAEAQGIASIMCLEYGVRAGPDWKWLVRLFDNSHWWVVGGCDYTGWDCQSWLSWIEYRP